MEGLVAEVTSLDETQADALAFGERTGALARELDDRIEPFLDSVHEDLSKLRGSRLEAGEEG